MVALNVRWMIWVSVEEVLQHNNERINMKNVYLDNDSAVKILAKAVGSVLKESEGIALEMEGVWYTVHKENDELHITLLEEERRVCKKTGKTIKDMELVYIHNELMN